MTLPFNDRYVTYDPLVPTTTFDVDFPIFSTADLEVLIDGVATLDFTVTASFVQGKSVDAQVILTEAVTGVTLEIFGNRDPRRDEDVSAGGADFIDKTEADLEAIVATTQEVLRDARRALLLPVGETGAIATGIPVGRTLIKTESGFGAGPDATDILNATPAAAAAAASALAAETSASEAEASAIAAEASATAAQATAQVVADAVPRFLGERYVTANETYMPAAEVTMFDVEMVGAGSGGSGCPTSAAGARSAAGAPGGAGAYGRRRITNVEASYDIVIGAAGTGGAVNAEGTSGTATTFTGAVLGTLSCGGGVSSDAILPSTTGDARLLSSPGGVATGPFDLSLPGAMDGVLLIIGGLLFGICKGGDTPLGAGGVNSSAVALQRDAEGFGAGGYGGISENASTSRRPGGDGRPGLIILREYGTG